jgi:hypothetical protein
MPKTIQQDGRPERDSPEGLIECAELKSAPVRFEAGRKLVHLSKTSPAILYPRFDQFVRMLDSPNQVTHWNGIFVLANLAAVDTENKWDGLIDAFLQPVCGPQLITAANTIKCLPGIARARPQYAEKLEAALLGVVRGRYQTRECRNVALGHALRSLDQIWDLLPDPAAALEFARRQSKNPRNATRRAAEAIVRRRTPSVES